MLVNPDEILETIKMVQWQNLDIRTVTLGISLHDCTSSNIQKLSDKIYDKITKTSEKLSETVNTVSSKYGVPIVNKRIAVTPIAYIGAGTDSSSFVLIAEAMDKAANEVGVDFIGGFSALVHKGYTRGDHVLINSLPEALSTTDKVCSSVNVASTKAGINMDAVSRMGKIIKECSNKTKTRDGVACAKLVVFANVPEDNPFMAGAFHGFGEAETTINIGISGPGVVNAVVGEIPNADFGTLAEAIKKTAFKITRAGELVGREVCKALQVPFGIVDLSLAPTPSVGDSVANILEGMGLERCGAHGTTAALALLNDAVKKGGLMASSYVGGLSGAFIPVSEDQGMIEAVECGALSIDKLEAMTSVCSVGLDMIAIPGNTPHTTISAIIADEMAIGVINNKTTAVRIIPAPGKSEGDYLQFGGLLGRAPVMPVSNFSSEKFINRGGRIPAPTQSLTN